jgi:hypothetical protein
MSYQRSITLLYGVTRAQESVPRFIHMFDVRLGLDQPVIHNRCCIPPPQGALCRDVASQGAVLRPPLNSCERPWCRRTPFTTGPARAGSGRRRCGIGAGRGE